MLQLSRTGIRNLASSDSVYMRGLHHYKNKNVTSAAFSQASKQFRLTVKEGFSFSVMITEKEKGFFEHSCNCAEHLKENGACQHVVAALLFILHYQNQGTTRNTNHPAEKKAYQILEYFSNLEELQNSAEIFHIDSTITVPTMMRDHGNAFLSLAVGSGRRYKIQSLKRFLSDYLRKDTIVLGKEFRFVVGESEFDHASKELLDFLLEIYDVQLMVDQTMCSKLFHRSQMILSERLLLRLFRIIGKNPFQLNLYEKTYKNVKFFPENPNIKYELDVVEDAILLDYRDRDTVIPLTDRGDIIYYNGAIFMPDSRFRKNYLPFFTSLGGEKKPLIFRGDNKQRFLEEVLPKLHDSMDIDIPEEIQDRYLTFPLNVSIYFDKYKNGIRADLKFKYGDYEFTSFEEPKSDFYIIMRDRQTEQHFIQLLMGYGFEAFSSFFLMKGDSEIYEFLLAEKDQLFEHCSLFYTEAIRRLKIRSSGKFSVGLKIDETTNLLELELDHEEIPREELQDMFRSLKVKKKFYRMKDGSFVDLYHPSVLSISEILDNLSIKNSDIEKETIKLPKSAAFYLEEALENADFQITKNVQYEMLISQIKHPCEKEYHFPDGINAVLRPYQVNGYRWLCTLAENSLGGILADDMGLGKTLQAIIYIQENRSAEHSFLIVCPSSIVYNWLDEFENFAPTLKACVVTGNPIERKEIIESYQEYDILITSYPLIRRDIVHYQSINFNTIFLDEAQYIKNAASINAQSVKLLNSKHRFALTGTPIENSLSELWSIFDFLMPGFLMTHTRFVQHFEKKILSHDADALDRLNRRIQPFILRRMKKEVLQELPGKTEDKIVTEMTLEQKKVYLSYMENIRGELYGNIHQYGISKARMQILAALTRLRQICCHPSTFLENYQGGSGKLNLLIEVIGNAIANEHRILVFSQFTSMLDIIRTELEIRKISYFYLEGATSLENRSSYVKQFNGGEREVFLISLKAGGTGLNLTGADMVIHYDPWWNPAVEEQATDRAYRIGQANNVYVLRLLTKGTIEEKIYKLQQKKKELTDSVILSKEVFLDKLTAEELEDIFRF